VLEALDHPGERAPDRVDVTRLDDLAGVRLPHQRGRLAVRRHRSQDRTARGEVLEQLRGDHPASGFAGLGDQEQQGLGVPLELERTPARHVTVQLDPFTEPELRGARAISGPRLALTLDELGDLTGKRVLDIGCGPGRYAVSAAERGADVVGIDISPAMLELARRRARERGVSERCRFVEADFDAYEPGGRFDIVLMVGFVEYRPDPQRQLARVHELTTEKAIVSIPLPYRWQTIARRVRHGLRRSPPSFHAHRPAAIAACLEEVGFGSWRLDRGWFVAYRGSRGTFGPPAA
jgi:2-polyprenyl-3-methyl-5-hydroxy-6-metoxy-1,4-benzoquinol methylase